MNQNQLAKLLEILPPTTTVDQLQKVMSTIDAIGAVSAPRPARAPKAKPKAPPKAPRIQSALANKELLETILTFLREAPDGLRAEQLRKATGFPRSLIARACAVGLSEDRIRRIGEKRTTTYFAV